MRFLCHKLFVAHDGLRRIIRFSGMFLMKKKIFLFSYFLMEKEYPLKLLVNKLSWNNFKLLLTLSWRRPSLYRNQSIDLRNKSMDWFLYDNGLRHETVNPARPLHPTEEICGWKSFEKHQWQRTALVLAKKEKFFQRWHVVFDIFCKIIITLKKLSAEMFHDKRCF